MKSLPCQEQTKSAARDAGQKQFIECGKIAHYTVSDTPALVGVAHFSETDKREMPVYEADGVSGKWSSTRANTEGALPAIGSRVKINFNELGSGEVTGYFFESGWIGCYVALDKEPAWRKKQSSAGKPAMVFGAEINPL